MPIDLRQFMGSRYLQVNVPLRAGLLNFNGQPPTPQQQQLQQTVQLIDHELNQLGEPLADVQFLGRRAGDAAHYDGLALNNVFSTSGYMSTSTNRSYWTAQQDMRNQAIFAIIPLPDGGGRDVSALRNNQAESEVIFHRDTPFIVTDVERLDNGNVRYFLREIQPAAAPVAAAPVAAAALAAVPVAAGPAVAAAAAPVAAAAPAATAL